MYKIILISLIGLISCDTSPQKYSSEKEVKTRGNTQLTKKDLPPVIIKGPITEIFNLTKAKGNSLIKPIAKEIQDKIPKIQNYTLEFIDNMGIVCDADADGDKDFFTALGFTKEGLEEIVYIAFINNSTDENIFNISNVRYELILDAEKIPNDCIL